MTVVHAGKRHERDVFIDVVRVVAVVVVVAAHWATTTVVWEEGRIAGENALSTIPEIHPVTWLVQVMPLLFFAGGFANARLLAHHDGEYLAYLRTRLIRLLTPTIAFLSAWLLVGIAAEPMPLPEPNVIERAADLAALPFWFLGLYILVVALAPAMWRLRAWSDVRVLALLVAGAVAVDVLVHGLGYEEIGVANYAFVWLVPHQLGFIYASGRLDGMSAARAGALAMGGLLALLAAVTIGGYPVSMVGVPGEDRWNTDPPSLPLLAMTMWLVGIAFLARPGIESWAHRGRRLLVRLRGLTLTMYLWHVTALAVAAAVVYPLGFPRPVTGSAWWWATRPFWLAAAVPVLVLFAIVFRRFEVHPPVQPVAPARLARTRVVTSAIGVVSLALGVLGFGVTGFDHVAADHGEGILAFTTNPLQNLLHVAVGVGVLWAVYVPPRFVPAAATTCAVYVALGAAGWSGGVGPLALNAANARLHMVLGAAGAGLLGAALARDQRHARAQRTSTPGDGLRP